MKSPPKKQKVNDIILPFAPWPCFSRSFSRLMHTPQVSDRPACLPDPPEARSNCDAIEAPTITQAHPLQAIEPTDGIGPVERAIKGHNNYQAPAATGAWRRLIATGA